MALAITAASLFTTASAVGAIGAPGVDPAHVDLQLHPGDSTKITKTVKTPEILPKPDIYFLADTTGSMGGALANVQANANDIMTQVDAVANQPQFGAGQYKDFPASFGFQNDAAITADKPTVTTAIGTWTPSFGGDLPEANLFALHKLVTAANFRSDSSRIVVWFGDAPGHDSVCSTISGETDDVTEASVTAELAAAGIKVIAVSVTSGAADGLNGDPAGSSGDYGVCGTPGGATGQADRIALATGGQAFSDVPAGDVANKIIEGLTALPVTVKPVATCTPGLSATFDPAEKTVSSGSEAVFEETIAVAADAVAGMGTCTVDFLINGLPAGDAFIETNSVRINRPPNCAMATVTPPKLWPPNHKFQTVTASVPDPDGDVVTTTITAVTQDEALNTAADGNTTPDAAWVAGHSNQVQVRAERSGQGDGRVYRISVSATDGKDTCTSGKVYVSVPHDQSGPAAVDTAAVIVNSFG
ncbi:MAG TPA: vWA domain-containing protein [Kineosporiaceae bacterium]|nr:vWA domain-containing protein [Kineosporiaceae bacterium]